MVVKHRTAWCCDDFEITNFVVNGNFHNSQLLQVDENINMIIICFRDVSSLNSDLHKEEP